MSFQLLNGVMGAMSGNESLARLPLAEYHHFE